MLTFLDECPVCYSNILKSWDGFGTAPTCFAKTLYGFEMLRISVVSFYTECLSCTTVFQNPRPSPEEMHSYYASGEYGKSLADTKPDADYAQDEQARAERVAGLFEGQQGAHLDVGSSRGYLLDEVGCKDRWAIEIGASSCHKSVQVTHNVDDVPDEHFDLVTAVHVLEHVEDPMACMVQWAKKLKPDGTMYVEVPALGGNPLRLAHLYFFRPSALAYIINQAELEMDGINIRNTDIGAKLRRRA